MSFDPMLPLFVGAGCVLAVLLVHSMRQRTALDKHGIQVIGEIVELKVQGLDFMHRYLVIRFQTPTGQWATVSSSERVDVGVYSKGQKVEVIYLPTNPEQFRVVSELEILLRSAHPCVPSRLAKGQERRYGPKSRTRNA